MRVVLDTGLVVSALLFPRGRLLGLRDLWTAGTVTPLQSRATAEESLRVLAYPKFQLEPREIEAVLAAYLPFCLVIAPGPRSVAGLPRCSDPADQKFLELAHDGAAEALVTSDRALLALRGRTPFEIQSPGEWRRGFADR